MQRGRKILAGGALVAGLIAGMLFVYSRLEPPAPARPGPGREFRPAGKSPVAARSLQEKAPEKIERSSGWTITGTAVGEDRSPIPGAAAILRLPANAPIDRGIAGRDGIFKVSGGPPGRIVEVELSAEGFASRVLSWTLSPDLPAHAPPVQDLGQLVLGKPCDLTVLLRGSAGEPVEGARVILLMDQGDQGESSFLEPPRRLAEEGGAYRIEGIQAGEHSLSVNAEGFAPHGEKVKLPREGPLVIALERGEAIAGIVTDLAGSPVPRAAVTAFSPELGDVPRAAVTGPDGRFEIRDLPAGLGAGLQVSAEGFVIGKVLSVTAGTLDLVIRLSPAAGVTGRVLAADGSPAAGAEVVLKGDDSMGPFPSAAQAAKDGSFSLDRLPAGRFHVEVEHDLHGSGRIDEIDLAPGERKDLGDILLEAGPSLRLLARDKGSGEPAPGVKINLGGQTQTTGSDGSAGFLNLPLGTTALIVESDRYWGTEPVEVEVREGENRLDVLLLPGGTIRGLVADSEGGPIPDAKVTADRDLARSDKDGSFELRGIAPGSYILRGSARGFIPSTLEGVVVEAGKITDARIVLYPGARITGRVFSGKVPAGGAVVSARTTETEKGGRVSVGTEGIFLLDGLPAGVCSIEAEFQGHRLEVGGVLLEAGKTIDVGDILFEAGGEVSGRLADTSGAPIEGAKVRMRAGNVSGPPSGTSDSSGSFRITGLLPGEWTLEAEREGFRSTTKGVMAPSSGNLIEMAPVGRLSGRIVDVATGAPIAGAEVLLFPDDEQSTSDDAGRFAFEDLLHGTFRISARARGYIEAHGQAAVPEGKGDLRLALSMGTAFRARVVDEEDRPQIDTRVRVFDPEIGLLDEEFRGEDDGTIKIPALREGPHRFLIYSWSPGHALGDFNADVRAGAAPPTFVLRKSGILRVSLRPSLKDVEIAILDVQGKDWAPLLELFGAIDEDLDASSVEIEGLPLGRYRVRAKAGEAVSEEKEVEVGSEPAEITLSLP